MKEVNNFIKISGLMSFRSEDDLYHLQIIKRKKENPEIGSNSIVVKTYYVRSHEYLDLKREEIITLCKLHRARACINLNRRSFYKMAFNTLKKISDQILNQDYMSVRKAYESTCGAHSSETEKKWIIDVDSTNKRYVNDVLRIADRCDPDGSKFISIVETPNGNHLITKPFNVKQFKEIHENNYSEPVPDIQKNNPTILYSNF